MKSKTKMCTGRVVVALLTVAVGIGGWRASLRIERNRLGRALILALQKHDSALALALLEAGANPNARVSDDGPLSISDLICRLYHDLHERHSPFHRNDGSTALVLAIDSQRDSGRLVQALLAHGANANLRYNEGGTPLMEAAGSGQEGVIRLCCQHGAQVNARTDGGRTALMYAATFNRSGAVGLLLDFGADASMQTKEGETALMQAISFGDYRKTVDVLLARKAQVNLKDSAGEGALDVAIKYGRTEMIAALKKVGAMQYCPTPVDSPRSMFGGDLGMAYNTR